MGVVITATGGGGRGDVCTGESCCDACEVGGARVEEEAESETAGRGGAGAPATADM